MWWIIIFLIVVAGAYIWYSSRKGVKTRGGADTGDNTSPGGFTSTETGPEDPLKAAKERYDKGEITKEEYERIMRERGPS